MINWLLAVNVRKMEIIGIAQSNENDKFNYVVNKKYGME